MSKRDNTEPLFQRVKAKLKGCREARIFLEKAAKHSGGSMGVVVEVATPPPSSGSSRYPKMRI